jgi:hypothetical protein
MAPRWSARCAYAPDDTPLAVHVLTADSEVNGVLERYIERGIEHPEDNQALAVVICIDTPGRSIDSMKKIVGHIEASEVPVITGVGPAGAQAVNAGTCITMAGNIAAMAPNITIGAATPIQTTGEDIPGALGSEHLRLARALGLEDRRLLGTLRAVDGGLAVALGFGDQGTLGAVSGEQTGHRRLNVGLRRDLAYLDPFHLYTSARGLGRKLHLQPLVDGLALGQHLLDGDAADHGAEGRRCHVPHGSNVVVDVDDRGLGVNDAHVDHKIDIDARVVLGNRGLRRLVEHNFSLIDLDAAIDERNQDDQTWSAGPDVPAQPEDHGPFVLLNHADEEHMPTSWLGASVYSPRRGEYTEARQPL